MFGADFRLAVVHRVLGSQEFFDHLRQERARPAVAARGGDAGTYFSGHDFADAGGVHRGLHDVSRCELHPIKFLANNGSNRLQAGGRVERYLFADGNQSLTKQNEHVGAFNAHPAFFAPDARGESRSSAAIWFASACGRSCWSNKSMSSMAIRVWEPGVDAGTDVTPSASMAC